jgi:hypothetical protein
MPSERAVAIRGRSWGSPAEDGEGEKIDSIGDDTAKNDAEFLPIIFPIGISGKIQATYIRRIEILGAPEQIRTPDPQIRSLSSYHSSGLPVIPAGS